MNKVICAVQQIKIGETVGKLTAIGPAFGVRRIRRGKLAERAAVQVFQCECGRITASVVSGVVSGKTVSCGCRHREACSENGKKRRRHGESYTPLHNLWHLIKQRCFDENQKAYKWYGARGITMCDSWSNDYEAFRDYLLSHGWKHGLQVDRINNDGNYEPGNIRFVSCTINARNRRRLRSVTAWNETKLLVEWAEDNRCAVSSALLAQRLSRAYGTPWTPEMAIQTPPLPFGAKRPKTNPM